MVLYFGVCITAFVWLITPAYGAVPSETEVVAAHARCDMISLKNQDLTKATRQKCKLVFNTSALQQIVDAGNPELQSDLENNRATIRQLDEVIGRLQKPQRPARVAPVVSAPPPPTAPATLAPMAPASIAPLQLSFPPLPALPPAPPSAPVSAPPSVPVQMTQPPMVPTGGYRIVAAPGQYVAATFDDEGWISRMRIYGLQFGAHDVAKNTNIVRAGIYKNGQFLKILTPSGLSSQIYVDLNRDGKVDSEPCYVVDPYFVDALFVQTLQNDNVHIVWFVRSGLGIQVPGLQTQDLWTPAGRTNLRSEGVGRTNKFASRASYDQYF